MSYDDYVRHIALKYRLAISLSVIRTKPENISLENYIQQLRDKLNNQMDSDDLSLSLCSDDFRIDETDSFGMNIDVNEGDNFKIAPSNDIIESNDVETNNTLDLGDFVISIDQNNDKNMNQQLFCDKNEDNYHQNVRNDEETINMLDFGDLDDNIDQNNGSTEYQQSSNDKYEEMYHQVETNDVDIINTQNNSLTISQSINTANTHSEIQQRSSLKNVMEILKGIDDNMTTIEKAVAINHPSQISQSTYYDSLQTQAQQIDSTQCFTDSNATLCEISDMFSNADNGEISRNDNLYNKSSNHKDGKTERCIPKTDIHTSVVLSNENIEINQYSNMINLEFNTLTNNIDNSKDNTTQNDAYLENSSKMAKSNPQNTLKAYRHSKEFINIYQDVANIFDSKRNKTVEGPDKTIKSDTIKEKQKDSQNSNIYTEEITCNTHCSESQVNDFIVIEDKYIHGTSKNNNKLEPNESTINKKKDVFPQEKQSYPRSTNITTISNIPIMYENKNDKYKVSKTINDVKDSREKESTKRKAIHIDNDIFSQESQLTNFVISPTNSSQIYDKNNDKCMKRCKGNVQENNDFLNHKTNDKNTVKYIDNDLFSQESQITNLSTLTNNSHNIIDNSLAFSQDAQRIDEYFDRSGQKSQNSMAVYNKTENNISLKRSCTTFDKDFENAVVTDQSKRCSNFDDNIKFRHVTDEVKINEHDKNLKTIEVIQNYNKSRANFDSMQVTEQSKPFHIDKSFKNTPVKNKNCTNFDSMQVTEHNKPCTKFDETFKSTPAKDKNCTNFDDNFENMDIEEWTDSQKELIPFKVIEEMNKVKMYLNRKNDKKFNAEGYSSDAGYRSDSQSKSSFKMSQTASGWLNQSAHSIFNYITECPLVVTTQDITNEISMVIGQLIDKLHEEEKYPSFLQELLDAVQLQLDLVYKDNGGENVLMKKDDIIQRILLLNKSIHIQKFTIEKITYILENLHTELTTNDSLYEIKNIDQIENICYIFHILETILQKYKKTSQNLSQSTQNSQEDEKILKKSNIMDIWRKKWNPNYKECVNEGSVEKKCVINSCSSILNKLIVGCMDGYSLISYFALKCFNVMQT